MQISRHLLLACAVATCYSPVFLRAYDNEAQTRARQALEEKMNQMEAQTNATPSNAAPARPAPVKKPKKSRPAAAMAQAPAPEISQPATPAAPRPAPVDAATADKLRDALHQQMGETSAPAAAPVTSTQPMAAPAQAETPVAQPAPATPASSATNGRLEQALHEKMAEPQP